MQAARSLSQEQRRTLESIYTFLRGATVYLEAVHAGVCSEDGLHVKNLLNFGMLCMSSSSNSPKLKLGRSVGVGGKHGSMEAKCNGPTRGEGHHSSGRIQEAPRPFVENRSTAVRVSISILHSLLFDPKPLAVVLLRTYACHSPLPAVKPLD